jgi:hypothetical protein
MATINHRWVERELKALLSLSQGVRKLAQNVLEKIEGVPASFDELDVVPLDLTLSPGVAIRKAKIVHRKHDYRILFLHRRSDEGSEHVDLLYIFKRKEGYHIDWEWIASVLGE